MRQETICEIDHESEGHAIPIRVIQQAIDTMPYASTERVMFQMLYYTGCRLPCLDKMLIKNLHGEWIYWWLSKNQRKPRKERLPVAYLAELKEYRATNRVPQDKLFGVTGETFRGYFKKFVRKTLPPAWQKKRPVYRENGMHLEYVYQIKGLRKNFQTLDFKRNHDKYGDAGLAIEKTSKRMGHSSYKITARHYIENYDALEINTLPTTDLAELLKLGRQRRMLDFY